MRVLYQELDYLKEELEAKEKKFDEEFDIHVDHFKMREMTTREVDRWRLEEE